jgi:hypothetical protein
MSDWGRAILVPAWIDLSGRGEEALAVPNFDNFVVGNLAVGATRHYFKQVAVRTNRRRWHMSQLLARHMALGDGVVHPVDLNVKFMMLGGMRMLVTAISVFAYW